MVKLTSFGQLTEIASKCESLICFKKSERSRRFGLKEDANPEVKFSVDICGDSQRSSVSDLALGC